MGVTTPRAADLPVGSVVAIGWRVWLKRRPDGWKRAGDTDLEPNVHVQPDLDNGAQVLRVGDGSRR
jgi:hypothetical protein